MLKQLSLLFALITAPFFAIHSEGNMKTNPIVVLETSLGTVEVTLKEAIAPKACENFTRLAQEHYYDGIVFHRVIKNFMIQGGDPSGTGAGGNSIWGKPFPDEYADNVTFNKPGLLAMANRGPSTNGSQFFITTASTPWLNGRHTIFGEVSSGYEVIQAIESVKTDASDRPVSPIKILKAYIKSE